MRRALTVLVVLGLTFGAGTTTPAHADEVVVVHAGVFPEPQEAGILARSCASPARPASGGPLLVRIRRTDDVPALGERMVGFGWATGPGTAAGPVAATELPSRSAWRVRLRTYAARTQGMYLAFFHLPGDQPGTWVGYRQVTVEGPGWHTLDGTGQALTWQYRNDTTGDLGPVQPAQTLAAFVASVGGDGTPTDPAGYARLGMAFGCDDSEFYLDNLQVGPPDAVTTYDLEGGRPVVLAAASAPAVTAGAPVALRGRPDPQTGAVEADLTLEARSFDQAEFTPVGTATATDDQQGRVVWASLSQRPQVRTEYRWVLPEAEAYDGNVSPVVTVQVRRAVTARAAHRTVRRGKRIVVAGRAAPATAGVATTLQRRTDGTWRSVARATTRADGSYTLRVRASAPGRWRLRVVVAATAANLAGTSPTRRVTVRR